MPESLPYTNFSFSGRRRGYLSPFYRSPDAGEGTLHQFLALRAPESIPFVILALSGRRRAPLSPISRSPGAGEPTFCHFGTLPMPESLPYTNFLFSGSRRGYLSPFGRSPRPGEPTQPTPTHLPKPEVGHADDYSRANRCRELALCKPTTFFRTRPCANFVVTIGCLHRKYAAAGLVNFKWRACRLGQCVIGANSSRHKREVPLGRGGW
jgi:hypothetical protein